MTAYPDVSSAPVTIFLSSSRFESGFLLRVPRSFHSTFSLFTFNIKMDDARREILDARREIFDAQREVLRDDGMPAGLLCCCWFFVWLWEFLCSWVAWARDKLMLGEPRRAERKAMMAKGKKKARKCWGSVVKGLVWVKNCAVAEPFLVLDSGVAIFGLCNAIMYKDFHPQIITGAEVYFSPGVLVFTTGLWIFQLWRTYRRPNLTEDLYRLSFLELVPMLFFDLLALLWSCQIWLRTCLDITSEKPWPSAKCQDDWPQDLQNQGNLRAAIADLVSVLLTVGPWAWAACVLRKPVRGRVYGKPVHGRVHPD